MIPDTHDDRMNEILCHHFPVWDELAPAEQERVIRSARLCPYAQGEVVHNGSNDCVGVIFVLSGELRASMIAANGRSITLFRIFTGESCVLSASCALLSIDFDVHIDAQADSQLLIIPSDVYQALMNNVQVKAYTYEQTALRFSEVMWVFYQVLFVSFDRRLANYLLEVSEPARPSGLLTVKRTHEEIAEELGSAREVVSRMLKYFSQEGLIESSRGTITLIDTNRLTALANSEEQ